MQVDDRQTSGRALSEVASLAVRHSVFMEVLWTSSTRQAEVLRTRAQLAASAGVHNGRNHPTTGLLQKGLLALRWKATKLWLNL